MSTSTTPLKHAWEHAELSTQEVVPFAAAMHCGSCSASAGKAKVQAEVLRYLTRVEVVIPPCTYTLLQAKGLL